MWNIKYGLRILNIAAGVFDTNLIAEGVTKSTELRLARAQDHE